MRRATPERNPRDPEHVGEKVVLAIKAARKVAASARTHAQQMEDAWGTGDYDHLYAIDVISKADLDGMKRTRKKVLLALAKARNEADAARTHAEQVEDAWRTGDYEFLDEAGVINSRDLEAVNEAHASRFSGRNNPRRAPARRIARR